MFIIFKLRVTWVPVPTVPRCSNWTEQNKIGILDTIHIMYNVIVRCNELVCKNYHCFLILCAFLILCPLRKVYQDSLVYLQSFFIQNILKRVNHL